MIDTDDARTADPGEVMARWAMGHVWLPHFWFRSPRHGDAVLVSGGRAVAVYEVRRTEPSASPNRERDWFLEQIAAAARRLDAALPEPERYVDGQGGGLLVRPGELTWSGLLIVDHPALPAGVDLVWAGERPLVVLLRSDWDFVLHELRSAAAVVRYLDFCAGRGPREVPPHFGWLAIAAERPVRAPAGEPPVLPLVRVDLPGHAVVGRMLDFVAETVRPDEPVRHRLLSWIDAFPVERRAGLGRWAVQAIGDGGLPRVRTFRFAGVPAQYVLAVAGEFTESMSGPFQDLVRLRHHEARDQAPLVTFGFVLLAQDGPGWPRVVAHFTCLQGPVEISAADRARIRQTWSELVS